MTVSFVKNFTAPHSPDPPATVLWVDESRPENDILQSLRRPNRFLALAPLSRSLKLPSTETLDPESGTLEDNRPISLSYNLLKGSLYLEKSNKLRSEPLV